MKLVCANRYRAEVNFAMQKRSESLYNDTLWSAPAERSCDGALVHFATETGLQRCPPKAFGVAAALHSSSRNGLWRQYQDALKNAETPFFALTLLKQTTTNAQTQLLRRVPQRAPGPTSHC